MYGQTQAGAERLAAVLVKRLGAGWKPEVWENLGWCYSAESPCGRMWVSQSGESSFLALLGDPEEHSHAGIWSAHGKTPKAAVKAVVAEGKKGLQRCERLLAGL
jgi:hypothetical protein